MQILRRDHIPHVRDFMTLGPCYTLLCCDVSIFKVNKVGSGPPCDQTLLIWQIHQSAQSHDIKTDEGSPNSPWHQRQSRSPREYRASAADIRYRTLARRVEGPFL